MSRNLKAKLLLVLGVLLFLVAGGLYWYLAVYAKTPEYAVQMIQRSLEEHDKADFHKYVDTSRLLDDAYDDLVSGLMDTQQPMSEETKAAVEDIARILKDPLISSFQAGIDRYVETGTWENSGEGEESQGQAVDFHQALLKSGIKGTDFRGVDSIGEGEEAGTAVAHVRVFQPEAGAEFVMEVLLRRAENGVWRAESIENFHDFVVFVGQARRAELMKYVGDTADIMSKHDKAMRNADFDFQRILAAGSLGKQGTREELKHFMENVVAKDWKERRDELDAVAVPEEAQSLQRLRLRICDLHIAYAEGYAAWLDDKTAVTLRDAEAKLKQARTLEQEAGILAKRMGGSPNDI